MWGGMGCSGVGVGVKGSGVGHGVGVGGGVWQCGREVCRYV